MKRQTQGKHNGSLFATKTAVFHTCFPNRLPPRRSLSKIFFLNLSLPFLHCILCDGREKYRRNQKKILNLAEGTSEHAWWMDWFNKPWEKIWAKGSKWKRYIERSIYAFGERDFFRWSNAEYIIPPLVVVLSPICSRAREIEEHTSIIHFDLLWVITSEDTNMFSSASEASPKAKTSRVGKDQNKSISKHYWNPRSSLATNSATTGLFGWPLTAGPVIGEGAYGKVREGIHLPAGAGRAAFTIRRGRCLQKKFTKNLSYGSWKFPGSIIALSFRFLPLLGRNSSEVACVSFFQHFHFNWISLHFDLKTTVLFCPETSKFD